MIAVFVGSRMEASVVVAGSDEMPAKTSEVEAVSVGVSSEVFGVVAVSVGLLVVASEAVVAGT